MFCYSEGLSSHLGAKTEVNISHIRCDTRELVRTNQNKKRRADIRDKTNPKNSNKVFVEI